MVRLFVCVFIGALANFVYANPQTVCKDLKTELRCGAGEVNNIKYIGHVNLSGTQVRQAVYTVGNFEAVNATLFHVYRIGDSYLQGSKVLEKFTSKGNITSQSTEFRGPNDITGNVIANHSQFIESTIITGNFIGDSNSFQDPVRIVGNFKGNQNVFHSQTEMIGELNVKSSHFYDRLLLTTNMSALDNTETNDIFIRKPVGSCCFNQVLYLKHDTQVRGNITFYSGKGVVVVSTGAKILGQVRGGKIVNREVGSV